MKLWKKAAAMVMALGMTFSVAACGEEGGVGSSVNSNSSSVTTGSSSSVTTNEGTSVGGGDSSAAVTTPEEKFMNAIEKTFNEAKSFSMSYNFKVAVDDAVGSMNSHKTYVQAKMPVTVSFEEGGANVHAEVIQVNADNSTVKQADVYVIDGYIYVSYRDYDYDTDTYAMSPYYKTKENLAGALEELQNMLNKEVPVMPEIMEIADELLAKIENADLGLPTWGDVKAGLSKVFTVEGNTMKLTIDAKEAYDTAIQEIIEYDTNRTVEAAIDEALLELVPAGEGETQLTMDGMLDEMATWGSITLEDLWADMDDWLAEEYQTDIQTLYNTVVNDDTFEKIVVLANNGSNEMVAQLQSMTDLHEAFFGDKGLYKDVTVDVIVDTLIKSMTAQPYPESGSAEVEMETITMQKLTDMVREQFSKTKLNEMEVVVELQEDVAELKEMMKLNEFSTEIGAEFEGANETLALKDLYYTLDFDMEVTSKMGMGTEDGSMTYVERTASTVMSAKYAFSDFSTNTVAIALPNNATIVEVWFCENGCGEFCIVSECTRADMDNAILCGACYALENPQSITLGETKNENLAANGGVAYEFTVTESGIVSLQVYGMNKDYEIGDVEIAIYDEMGNKITDSYGASYADETTGLWELDTEEKLSPGVYYAVVVSEADSTMKVAVKVEFDSAY